MKYKIYNIQKYVNLEYCWFGVYFITCFDIKKSSSGINKVKNTTHTEY